MQWGALTLYLSPPTILFVEKGPERNTKKHLMQMNGGRGGEGGRKG
jgi:hypothetical protein